MNVRAILGSMLVCFAVQAAAAEVKITAATVKATAPGQDSAAVALHIRARQDAKLAGASSPVAARVEIHVMGHENGMMMMREVDSLALPANEVVELGVGNHLMLVGLKRPLKAGESVPLSLTVEFSDKHKETIKVVAKVVPVAHDGGMPGMEGHDMKDMGAPSH